MTKTRLLFGFLCAFNGYAMAASAPAEKDVAQAVDHLTQAMLHKDIAEYARKASAVTTRNAEAPPVNAAEPDATKAPPSGRVPESAAAAAWRCCDRFPAGA